MTSFTCHCSKGTYIRSLARDMARVLGCYGHVARLRRIKVGKFTEAGAISLEDIEKMVHKGDLGFIQPVASALDDIPAVHVTAPQAAALMRGQTVVLPPKGGDSTVAAYESGKLIAICEQRGGSIKPVRVFNL